MNTPDASAHTRGATPPRVTLVGAGPGDPDLLTVKAIKALRQATVALVDDLVHAGVLRYLRRSARVIHVGKRGGCASTPQAFIHKLMVAEALGGERVVRIKGGDPFIFGRGGEECDALREAGIDVDVVGGITAGIAGPASIGVPVTDRRFTRGVALVTGHSGHSGSSGSSGSSGGGKGGGEPDWAALVQSRLTLVVYMGVSRWPHIAQALQAAGMPPGTPAAVVCHAHTAQQRQAVCTLGELQGVIAAQQLHSPAIVVLGDVVQASPLWLQRSLAGAAASPLCCKRHISA